MVKYQFVHSAILELSNPNNGSNLANMPSEIILTVFSYLDQSDLAKCARVCRRFQDLTTADCLWMPKAKESLATNCQNSEMKSKSVQPWISTQDRVRISQNWVRGNYSETQLIVQDIRYMPRIQLNAETIWVSWGAQVWAHPRRSDGTVCRTASQVRRLLFLQINHLFSRINGISNFISCNFFHFSTFIHNIDSIDRYVGKFEISKGIFEKSLPLVAF